MQSVQGPKPGQGEIELYDRRGRFRSKTIAFRASPEEVKQIEFAISLTGMMKQDYYIAKSLNREIHVTGNSRIHRAVFDRLTEVLDELRRIDAGQYIDEELTDNIKLLAAVIDSLYMKQP